MIDYLKPLRTYVGYMDETGLATIDGRSMDRKTMEMEWTRRWQEVCGIDRRFRCDDMSRAT
jgi:hypothetical protein